MSDSVTVNLTLSNMPNAARIVVEVNADDSPASFREKAAEASKIPLDSMRLIFRGRLVGKEDDKNVINEFKFENGSVIHCMGKPVETVAPPAAASVPTTAGSSVTVTAGASASTIPATGAAPSLASALTTLRTSNPSATYLTAVSTLEKVLSNIVKNPMEEKYRKVKRGNAAFNKRLGGLPGGEGCMMAVDFCIEDVDGVEHYVMHASAEAWPKLMQHVADLEAAVQTANNATGAAPMMAPPVGGTPAGMGGMPAGMGGMPAGMGGMPAGMGGMPAGMGAGGMAQMTPQMQQAAAQMMQNPEQLRTMLQNPMVQNMLRSDPRFANNPMMQQSIDHMTNNPQMLQQMSQMMQNPELLNMMGSGMGGAAPPQQQGGGGGGGSGNTNNDGRSDQEMTEEEMMEEAIRRSLNGN